MSIRETVESDTGFKEIQVNSIDERVVCPECGEMIKKGVRNCPDCGAYIAKTLVSRTYSEYKKENPDVKKKIKNKGGKLIGLFLLAVGIFLLITAIINILDYVNYYPDENFNLKLYSIMAVIENILQPVLIIGTGIICFKKEPAEKSLRLASIFFLALATLGFVQVLSSVFKAFILPKESFIDTLNAMELIRGIPQLIFLPYLYSIIGIFSIIASFKHKLAIASAIIGLVVFIGVIINNVINILSWRNSVGNISVYFIFDILPSFLPYIIIIVSAFLLLKNQAKLGNR